MQKNSIQPVRAPRTLGCLVWAPWTPEDSVTGERLLRRPSPSPDLAPYRHACLSAGPGRPDGLSESLQIPEQRAASGVF